jgi:hypothetical protein
MIGGRSYQVAPPPFAVSWSARGRQARAPPGGLDSLEYATGPAVPAASPGEPRSTPDR